MALVPALSGLTSAVVDRLYGIASARPVAAPTFVILAGAPGVGKSSGHAFAQARGLLPVDPRDYATINLDTLLESLAPFRAASSMAHFLKQNPATRPLTHFASIVAYGSRRENLGLFKWYDEAQPALAAADPETVAVFNAVRAEFAPLADAAAAPGRLLDINAAAIERAVAARVPIVWETTLSLSAKTGRVAKIDDLMSVLRGTPYRVALIHMTGDPTDIARRIAARQNYGMPYEVPPYYRYVKTTPEAVAETTTATATAVAALRRQYRGRIEFHEDALVMEPSRLPPPRRFNRSLQRNRIAAFYGPQREIPRSLRLSSNRRSSSFFRLSSSSSDKRKTVRRSRSHS
jgi:hypothetical protein